VYVWRRKYEARYCARCLRWIPPGEGNCLCARFGHDSSQDEVAFQQNGTHGVPGAAPYALCNPLRPRLFDIVNQRTHRQKSGYFAGCRVPDGSNRSTVRGCSLRPVEPESSLQKIPPGLCPAISVRPRAPEPVLDSAPLWSSAPSRSSHRTKLCRMSRNSLGLSRSQIA
jgi:hypothetical protein